MVVWWLLTKVTGLVHIEKTQLISESYNPPTAFGKDMENEPRTKDKRKKGGGEGQPGSFHPCLFQF